MQIRKIIQNKAQRNEGKYRGKGKDMYHRMNDFSICQISRGELREDETDITWREKS